MPDSHDDELAILVKEDFALPVTDAFITGVQRGVRRRRVLRAVAAGGGAAATVGIAALVVTLTGPAHPSSLPGSTTASVAVVSPTVTADPIHRPLDGYPVTFVPDGLRVGVDGTAASYAVSKNRLHNDDQPAPTSDPATAAVTLRTYVKANGGNWLWISVLRPERTTAEVDRAQVTAWLVGWSVKGREVIERYELPVGRAQLVKSVGSEVTTHNVVITTPDGAVISVGGNGAAPVADLKAVAAGLLPQ